MTRAWRHRISSARSTSRAGSPPSRGSLPAAIPTPISCSACRTPRRERFRRLPRSGGAGPMTSSRRTTGRSRSAGHLRHHQRPHRRPRRRSRRRVAADADRLRRRRVRQQCRAARAHAAPDRPQQLRAAHRRRVSSVRRRAHRSPRRVRLVLRHDADRSPGGARAIRAVGDTLHQSHGAGGRPADGVSDGWNVRTSGDRSAARGQSGHPHSVHASVQCHGRARALERQARQ